MKLLTNTKAFCWVENASSTVTDAAFQTKIPILPNWEPRFPDARSGWIATAKALNESRDNHRVTKSEAAN